MFSVVACIISLFKVPLFFFVPMYKLDLSESIVLLSSFIMGPFCGVSTAFFKEIINILFRGTRTLFLSEFINFFFSSILAFFCSTYIKKTNYSLKNMFVGSFIGIFVRSILSCILNYFFIIPIFSSIFLLPINKIITSANKFIPAVKNLLSFVIYIVAPFNIFKSTISCFLAIFIYKKLGKNTKIFFN